MNPSQTIPVRSSAFAEQCCPPPGRPINQTRHRPTPGPSVAESRPPARAAARPQTTWPTAFRLVYGTEHPGGLRCRTAVPTPTNAPGSLLCAPCSTGGIGSGHGVWSRTRLRLAAIQPYRTCPTRRRPSSTYTPTSSGQDESRCCSSRCPGGRGCGRPPGRCRQRLSFDSAGSGCRAGMQKQWMQTIFLYVHPYQDSN